MEPEARSVLLFFVGIATVIMICLALILFGIGYAIDRGWIQESAIVTISQCEVGGRDG